MKHFSRTAAAVSLTAALAPLAHPARADVKIVSTVSVTGQTSRPGGPLGRGPAYPRTVTAYYQGVNSRTEVAGGMVFLYTGQDSKTTVLDPVRKTYFVMSGPPNGGMLGALSATSALKPAAGTQTLAGRAAKKFLLSGSLKMNPSGLPFPGDNRRAGRDDFGGPPPPGGFGGPPPPGGFGGPPPGGEARFDGPPPGGGPGDDSRPGRRPPMAQGAAMTGEVWLSSTIKLPESSKEALLPLMREAVPGDGPLAMLVAGSVVQIHELPLLAKITLTPTAPAGAPSPPADAPKPAPTVATLAVTSVSTAALNPALFAVPQGYTLVSSPRPPRGQGRRPDMTPDNRGPNPGMPGGPPPGMDTNGGPPHGMGMNGGPPPPGDEINTAPLTSGGDMNTAPQGGDGMETAPQSGGGMNTAPLPPDSGMDPAAP